MSKNDLPILSIHPEDCLTTAQAAWALQIAPGTLQNWRSMGIGPEFIKHRRSVYYLKSEIEKYKEKYFIPCSSASDWKQKKDD